MNFPIRIEVPIIAPSLNTWERMHWGKKRPIKEMWCTRVFVALPSQQRNELIAFVAQNRPKMRLWFHQRRHGELDEDNLIGGLKVAIDALKVNRFLVDDSPKFMTLDPKPTQETIAKKLPVSTAITLEPVG